MTKEEIFELLKWLVLQTRDNGDKFNNPMLKADWGAKYLLFNNEVKVMNSCDADWMGERYVEWHSKEVIPYLKNPQNPNFPLDIS